MARRLEGLDELGFDTEAYVKRLRMLRQIVSGENQQDFAARLGVDAKRWNNYEQGYPVPRHVAMMIMKQFDGMSIEWLWFGKIGNLSTFYLEQIRAIEALERQQNKVRQHILQKAPAKPLPPRATATKTKGRARKRS
ncbi:helix-turn-helix domain-containing protein [Bradyrhizobium sp. Pa8]|uniref:helix-turn-helix domain-containing protein n=1 Tax=Bradyrhizobium sp. Pa8 TaxID=3386552 RepID=UPI00403F3B4C